MRLIDAKGLEKQVKQDFVDNPGVMGIMLRWIRKQKSIDGVLVSRGKWENCFQHEDSVIGFCTNCGHLRVVDRHCAWCGAEMDLKTIEY